MGVNEGVTQRFCRPPRNVLMYSQQHFLCLPGHVRQSVQLSMKSIVNSITEF